MPNSRSFISRVDILKRYHWHNAYLPSLRNLSVPNDPRIATSLNDLAVVYQEQGRSADAEPLFKRALAICEKALGPNHPDVATVAEQPG